MKKKSHTHTCNTVFNNHQNITRETNRCCSWSKTVARTAESLSSIERLHFFFMRFVLLVFFWCLSLLVLTRCKILVCTRNCVNCSWCGSDLRGIFRKQIERTPTQSIALSILLKTKNSSPFAMRRIFPLLFYEFVKVFPIYNEFKCSFFC